MIKTVNCLDFVFANHGTSGQFVLESELQFSAQVPKDSSLSERAIAVKFDAKGDNENFQLKCICRVVFAFESDKLLEGQALLKQHKSDAYSAMKDLVNNMLKAMGNEELHFPEIDFG